MKRQAKTGKKMSGQSMVTLGLILAVGVILALGLITFEINRIELAREQLRVACDAASLAAAATLASSDNVNVTSAQNQAIATALTTFQANTILGTSLSSSTTSSSIATPAANQAVLNVQLLDPHNGNAPVAVGNAAGKVISVSATYGLVPAFGQLLGIGQIPVTASSSGGVPNLDVVLCFDVSASIDDQTPVTFVRRRWDLVNGVIAYDVTSTSAGSPAGNLAQGTIFNILGPPATGSSVNGLYPQQVSATNNGQSSYPLDFSEVRGHSGSAVGLRGATNAGSPPGNYPPGTAGIGNARTYTDLVVNIDGNTQFAGITSSGGYKFPNLATLVEAARGNLENNTVFTNSKANTSVPSTVTPTAGYQAEYFRLAAMNVHPLYDAQQAAQQFYTIMNTNTDAHFGLVSFTTNAGTSSTSNFSTDNIDGSYSAGGTGSFPVPTIALSNVTGTTNYSSIMTALPQTVACSSTNIGDALNKAVTELKNNSRPGSKKAIVLFTDGQPTAGGPLDNDPWLNARKAAVLAQNAGIPIYTIGLAQTPAIIPGETSILNDTNSNTSTGGVAAIAGNGGKFFLVTKTADLRYTFENIARQLVQLVQ